MCGLASVDGFFGIFSQFDELRIVDKDFLLQLGEITANVVEWIVVDILIATAGSNGKFVSPVIESAFRPAGDIVDYCFDACKRSRKSAHIGEGVFFVEVQVRGRRKLRQRPWRRALV